MRKLLVGVGMVVLVGCSSSVDDVGSAETPNLDAVVEQAVDTGKAVDSGEAERATAARLVASLTLANGNTLEFYDFDEGAVVSETGEAYVDPMYEDQGEDASHLLDIWDRYANGAAPPAKLEALQDRLTDPDRKPSQGTGTQGETAVGQGVAPGAAAPSGPVQIESPVGCNNGCCDYDWLSTFSECDGSGWDFSWFDYNLGYGYRAANDIIWYHGMVCSANGTSSYNVNISGAGGSWSIAQAHYRTYHWLAPYDWFWCAGYCGRNMTSSVNSSTNQHLHTYCGKIIYD